MRRRVNLLIIFVFGVFFLMGCDNINFLKLNKKEQKQEAAPSVTVTGTVIAKVNNLPITLQDLDEEIVSYNSIMEANNRPDAKVTTREQKINYLKNELVRRTLLYQEALDRGLEREENVRKAIEKTKMELLVVELLRKEAEKIDVSSQEVEDYYNTYKGQLKEPEERRIREIVVATEQEAKDIMIQLLQGSDFSTLARERSAAASKTNGGDLGYIKPGQKTAQFDAAAFSDSLGEGSVSNIFKDADGYYILKLEAKRGGKERALSDMWDDIKRGLTFLKQQQEIDNLIGKLSRDSKIEIYEGEIK